MPIPPQCFNQDCPLQCCDINGYCPSTHADCYYLYSKDYIQFAPGIIVAIVIGCVCVFTIIIMIICFFFKRCKDKKIQPRSPRRNSHGAHSNRPHTIIVQRDQPSYGTESFQDLIMAENRRIPYSQPISDPPTINAPAYFQANIPEQNNINPYYNS